MLELKISSDLLERITAEAAASPQTEICGLLFGDVMAITAAHACRNVAADPARRFEIDPVALLAAHRGARSGGPHLIGHYHSHPSGGAVPSPRDAADAAPDDAIWLIVADGGRAWDARAWRAVTQGAIEGRFDPVALVVSACAAHRASPQGRATTRGSR